MDITEFKNRASPSAIPSKLAAFEKDILHLHQEGYTNIQITEYLSHNGCKVSHQAISKFLKKRLTKKDAIPKPVSYAEKPPEQKPQKPSQASENLSWNEFRNKTDVESLM